MHPPSALGRKRDPIHPASPGNNTATPLKILVASHSHPALTKGGAEISAYALYSALEKQDHIRSWFLGCSNGATEQRVGACISQPFEDSEFIYRPTGHFDHFKLVNRDPAFPRAFERLIIQLRPDIIHLHHYVIFGVEMPYIIKNIRPQTKIVMTLHEFIAICHNHGQMVKEKTRRLCRQDSLVDCPSCFPDIAAQDFFLRKTYVQHFFSLVDRFICPSKFLAQRYIAWGIPADKILVLENILPGRNGLPPPPEPDPIPLRRDRLSRLRIGYFGQMSALKGIGVLVQAAKILHDRQIQGISFDVFGDYSNQPPSFQEEVKQALADSDLNTNFTYHGPYENEDVHTLMRSVDVVVVPSIWWENSPVVIQEAFASRRPVICSNIGGMAEKVRPGIDGWHFRAGDASSLAALLDDLVNNPKALEKVQETLKVPASTEEHLQEHLCLYRDLCTN